MAKQVRTVYGNALFEAARDAGRITSVREEAETILEAFRLEPDFLRILCHPEILPDEKEGILNSVFGETADPLILAIMEALLERNTAVRSRRCSIPLWDLHWRKRRSAWPR